MRVRSVYPCFDLCTYSGPILSTIHDLANTTIYSDPSVYPAITLYAPIPGGIQRVPSSRSQISQGTRAVRATASQHAIKREQTSKVCPHSSLTYRHVGLALYPVFEIYAGEVCDGSMPTPTEHYTSLPVTYPRFAICELSP